MLIFLFRFKGLDRIDFFKNMQISRMALKPNKNVRNILHTYKNEMLSINMIAKQLEDVDDIERQEYLINRLSAISENALSNVLKAMTNYRNVDFISDSCDIAECIENAVEKIVFDNNIIIEKSFENEVYALCDKYRLESVLENILCNAQEAIRIANRENGKITISLESEFEWVFIRITDNGIGIPKKDINKIFNAFYSTKLSSNNWGIGLNFVFRSIKVMKGFVYAQSEVNKYTTFTIMLQRIVPKSKKRKIALAKKE
jgi:signal transduction histidine kinase